MCSREQNKCASGSVGGARPCQGRGRGFESRLALLRKRKADTKVSVFLLSPEHETVEDKAARQPPRKLPINTVFGGGWNEMRMHFACSTVPSMRSGSRTSCAPSRAKFVCPSNSLIASSGTPFEVRREAKSIQSTLELGNVLQLK